MILSEFLRALKTSKHDHRARIGALLEPLTKRCSATSLHPEEEHVISAVVSEVENKMQRIAYTLTYTELMPLATWLNTLSLHNKR